MERYKELEEDSLIWYRIKSAWYLFLAIAPIALLCLAQTDWYKQYREEQYNLHIKGIVIQKVARPPLFFGGDKYYLRIKLDDEEIEEKRVAREVYMNINAGDRIDKRQL